MADPADTTRSTGNPTGSVQLAVIPGDFDWDDVGLWTALPKHLPPDPSGNTIRGPVASVASTNNIAVSNGRMIALCGVKDLVVVESNGTLLIVDKSRDQLVREASRLFEK